MRALPPCLVALALSAVAFTGAHAQGQGEGPECHGKPADFVGTEGDDVFHEDGGVFVLRGGRDRVRINALKDATVCGGKGRDRILVDGGRRKHRPLFDGGPGKDALGAVDFTETGTNEVALQLIGGRGPDALAASARSDLLYGGAGRDYLNGWLGDDRLKAGTGDDHVDGLPGDDRLFGGPGDDFLDGDRKAHDDDPPPQGEDFADGGAGRDQCQAEARRRCER